MKVSSISTIITPTTTGYTAAAGIGLTILSGISKNKTLKKTHKPLSIFSAFATILHIGLIEYYHYKYRVK